MSSPTHPLLELAMAHHRAGRLAEAEALYRQLLVAQPEAPNLPNLLGALASQHFHFGFAQMQQRRWAEAAESYRRALALRPELVDAHLLLTVTLGHQQLRDEAVAAARAAVERLPAHATLWNSLGIALRESGRLDEAIEAWRTALARDPREVPTLNNLGNALKDIGQIAEAIDCLRRAVEYDPGSSAAHSSLIFALHFDPATTADDLVEEQRRWCERHSDPLRQARAPHRNDRSPGRRLRIGFVSADLCEHPVGRMLQPVFAEHDRKQIDLVGYFDGHANDTLAQQLHAQAALARDTAAMNDDALAAQIRADGIDILVDLALHSGNNRLPVFARKPAPVQVSWLGYAGSSGLDTIDYRLSDAGIDPPGPRFAGEMGEVIRLPGCWCCYRPAALIAPEPRADRPFTFGSMNAFGKLNKRVFGTWAQILGAVESAHLLMIAPIGEARERVRRFFQERGVSPARIEFADRTTQRDYFRQYDRIDLALDSFPFNGMTTTGDALWMGVPVVSLAGILPVSRTARSLLTAVGLGALAVESEDLYVHLAVELAQNRSRLDALRTDLHARMRTAPLMDAHGFTHALQAAFRTMWRRWCGNALA